uniref:Uncharacterized protein n=1 Tax=Dulem virus 71 TaxID=3145782 RepID=A0AAU8AZF3_9VIRU
MFINILDVFKDFYFVPYLFGSIALLGCMYCLRLIVLKR